MKKAQAYEQRVKKGDHFVNVNILVCGPIEKDIDQYLFGVAIEADDGSDIAFAVTLNCENPDNYSVEIYGTKDIISVAGESGIRVFKKCFEHFLVNNLNMRVNFVHRSETH